MDPFDPYAVQGRGRPRRRKSIIGTMFRTLWRLVSFTVLSVLVLGLSAAGLMFLSPEAATKVQALVPENSRYLPQEPEPTFAPQVLDPGPDAAPPDFEAAEPGQERPTPGRESQSKPLGTPAPVPAADDRYALLIEDTAYDPCRPIHYVINPANMPEGGERLIHQAVASVSKATGLVFISDGETREPASKERRAFQPERYGDRWAPVLFIWKTEAQQPAFTNIPGATNTVGLGGSNAYTLEGAGSLFVTGEVQLNTAVLTEDLQRPGGEAGVRSVIQHELAHVVGLAHVDDSTQLMAPTATDDVDDFAAGDLNGLAHLGRGACIPEL